MIKTLLPDHFVERMGGRQALKGKFSSIVSLNISDNPVDEIKKVVADITLLMPKLSDL